MRSTKHTFLNACERELRNERGTRDTTPDFFAVNARVAVLACAFKEETLEREGKVIVTAMHYTGVHFGAGRRGWNFENRPSHRGVIAYTWFELPLVTQMCICVHSRAVPSREYYKRHF